MNTPERERASKEQPNPSEKAAHTFFDMADKARTEEQQYPEEERYTEKIFSGAATETAQGNFNGAQRILEGGVQWDDTLRDAASTVNQLDQEQRGEKPLSFEQAQQAMTRYAREMEKTSKETGGTQQDLESAMALDNIVADMSAPGVEGIDNALKYIEGTLKSKYNIADTISKSEGVLREQAAAFSNDWREKRSVRDALYAEKQRRVEKLKQSERGAQELNNDRGETMRQLENMYADAHVSEDTPSRQALFGRVERMSPQELGFLNAALQEAAAQFGRSRDPKTLDGLLMDLSGKSFKQKDVVERRQAADQERIADIRQEINNEGDQQKEKSEPEKSEAAKKAFLLYRDKFSPIFQDPAVLASLDSFMRGNPSTGHYEAATAMLKRLYSEYMNDKTEYPDQKEAGGRLVSGKMRAYKEKFLSLAERLNPDRLKFNYFLAELKDVHIPGQPNLASAFDALYGDTARPTPEQWHHAGNEMATFVQEYNRDKRLGSEKNPEWSKKLQQLAQQDFLPTQ